MPDNTETYIKVLIDTLKKKEKVLTSLSECTKQQSQLLEADEFDTEAFNSIIEKKDILLEELQGLDDGFLDLYERVAV